MKKGLCFLVCVLMLVGLCGCLGDSGTDDVRGDIVTNATTTTTEESTTTTTVADDEPTFSLGKTSSNTYNNAFLGLSCELPSDWTFYTDDQIRELNNLALDLVEEDVAEALQNADVIFDMYATCATDSSNMNVNMQKLTALQLATLNIKNELEAQIDTIQSSYNSMGYTDIAIAYKKVTVDGKEYDGLTITAKIQGFDFYATCFAFRKGNYLANVTVCSLLTDKIDTILDHFTVA